MQYSREVEEMVCVKKGPNHGPAPIPEEGKWVQSREIKDISGFTHGVGWCAPQQGACKLSLNIKDGIIRRGAGRDAGLLRHDPLGRHGFRDSARQRPSSRRLTPTSFATPSTPPCANSSLQIAYGRYSESAFSEGGLWPSARGFEDLRQGPALPDRHHVRHKAQGRRATWKWPKATSSRSAGDKDKEDQICGYQVRASLGKMMDAIKKGGIDPKEAYEKNIGTYGRFTKARAKYIDPRHQ